MPLGSDTGITGRHLSRSSITRDAISCIRIPASDSSKILEKSSADIPSARSLTKFIAVVREEEKLLFSCRGAKKRRLITSAHKRFCLLDFVSLLFRRCFFIFNTAWEMSNVKESSKH